MEDNGSRRSVHKGKDIHRSASSRNFRRPLNVPQLDQSCCDSEAAATSPSISERCGLRSTAILLLMLVARSACASGLRTACRTGQSFGRKNPLCRARNATARAMSSNLHYPQPIKIDARGQHTATVIMLHGLGDSGDGWAGIGSQFAPELPHCRFLFPTAPEVRTWGGGGGRKLGVRTAASHSQAAPSRLPADLCARDDDITLRAAPPPTRRRECRDASRSTWACA